MKYDVKNRGTNTKEHWETSHTQMYIPNWKSYQTDEAIQNIIQSNWWHYEWVMNNILTTEMSRKNIVDIGCAPNGCLVSYALKYPDLKFSGIDFTDAILEYAKDFVHIPNLAFHKIDFLEQDIPGEYGAILMMETLEHVEDGVNFALVDDLLKQCEYFYISVPADDSSNGGEHISH